MVNFYCLAAAKRGYRASSTPTAQHRTRTHNTQLRTYILQPSMSLLWLGFIQSQAPLLPSHDVTIRQQEESAKLNQTWLTVPPRKPKRHDVSCLATAELYPIHKRTKYQNPTYENENKTLASPKRAATR